MPLEIKIVPPCGTGNFNQRLPSGQLMPSFAFTFLCQIEWLHNNFLFKKAHFSEHNS